MCVHFRVHFGCGAGKQRRRSLLSAGGPVRLVRARQVPDVVLCHGPPGPGIPATAPPCWVAVARGPKRAEFGSPYGPWPARGRRRTKPKHGRGRRMGPRDQWAHGSGLGRACVLAQLFNFKNASCLGVLEDQGHKGTLSPPISFISRASLAVTCLGVPACDDTSQQDGQGR